MLDEVTYLKQQNAKRTWFIGLAVAVSCCVVFLVLMLYFVTTWGKTLNAIDNRLANLEMRGTLPNLPPSAAAVPVPGPEIPPVAPPEVIPASATAPSAPPPSKEAPPAAEAQPAAATPSEPQMSVPPDRNVFIPAPTYPEPPHLP